MSTTTRRVRLAVLGATLPLALLAAPGAAGAAGPTAGPRGLTARLAPDAAAASPLTAQDEPGEDEEGGETRELFDRTEQYAAVRTAPAASVSSDAFTAAAARAAALPRSGGSWDELTDLPYDSDARNYRDPTWSNSSGGAGLVTGRMTALVTDGSTLYGGAADGGVWRSDDEGGHWTPVFDRQNDMSVGALAVDPADHSIWVGTGEANTAVDNFKGDGVYRSADRGATWQLVGDHRVSTLVSRLTFDGLGSVYAATSQGLLRRSALDLTAPWEVVLKPDPNPAGSPYRGSWISDVKVRPGSQGREVVAVLGWRGGSLPDDTAYNGFWVSHASGRSGTFTRVTAHGIPGTVGRTSLDYGPDGALLAIVENPEDLGLTGVFRSQSGFPTGPWTLVADEDELKKAPGTATGDPGAQAWYDQYVTVDPKDPKHIYVGLTEVYETSDGGETFTTIGPYWNFGKACQSPDPAKDTCPATTHADQHAAWVAADGTAYFANDGGVYSRPASRRAVVQWRDLNATLHTLQYYYAGVGALPSGKGDAVWGGLQDNGYSLLRPDLPKMVSPFGGDGTDLIVDPANGNRSVQSYVYLSLARTQNGGVSKKGETDAYTTITPTCPDLLDVGQGKIDPCDPNPRFVAPLTADDRDIDHWVAGGQLVWDNGGKGWATACTPEACDWQPVHDLGAGAQATALAVSGSTTYVGWCGNGCNPGGAKPFVAGIDTNAGGTWHRVAAPLTTRIPTSFAVDPEDAQHVFATYGSFSRRWIESAGVGHVFESRDGGRTWADRSGDLPDAPVNDVVLRGGRLLVATDVGVFTARAGTSAWSRLGTDLPGVAVLDLAPSPTGDYLVAATHGRGLWKLPLG